MKVLFIFFKDETTHVICFQTIDGQFSKSLTSFGQNIKYLWLEGVPMLYRFRHEHQTLHVSNMEIRHFLRNADMMTLLYILFL